MSDIEPEIEIDDEQRNVFGEPIEVCSIRPLTGFSTRVVARRARRTSACIRSVSK